MLFYHFHAFLQVYLPTNNVMCQRPRDVWVILGYVFWKLQKEFIDCRALNEGHPFGLFLFCSPSKRNLWLKALFTQSGLLGFFFRNKRGREGEKVVRAIKCKVKRMKRLRKTALVNLQSGRWRETERCTVGVTLMWVRQSHRCFLAREKKKPSKKTSLCSRRNAKMSSMRPRQCLDYVRKVRARVCTQHLTFCRRSKINGHL